MTESFIFISCGQYTDAERRLGAQISAIVKKVTDIEPFFAGEVQDLSGLHASILDALRNCVALIVVLHPRGKVPRPDGSFVMRASVWIEQEIAIATYIQHAEKPVPIIAFKHSSVDLEGIRTLLHLNPTEFADDEEVLVALPKLLERWKSLPRSDLQIELRSPAGNRVLDDHPIFRFDVDLHNGTAQRIKEYTCDVRFPAEILKHQDAHYAVEETSDEPGRRLFRFTERTMGQIEPGAKKKILSLEYCPTCAVQANMPEHPSYTGSKPVEVCVYAGGRKYAETKTLRQLADDRQNSR